MKRENIYKAAELDSRILQIDQELLKLTGLNVTEVVVRKSMQPELFEQVRQKTIEALKALRADYELKIEELA